jgi:hypothetical protein
LKLELNPKVVMLLKSNYFKTQTIKDFKLLSLLPMFKLLLIQIKSISVFLVRNKIQIIKILDHLFKLIKKDKLFKELTILPQQVKIQIRWNREGFP